MLKQTQMWMDALKPYLKKSVILAQCVKAYYNRSMTSKAVEILSAFNEHAKCEGTGKKQINFPSTFDIVKSDGYTKMATQQLHPKKMIVMVDNDCIFSKVLAVQMARKFEKSPVIVIIVPKKKLNAEMLALDKQCAKDLFFIKDKTMISEDILTKHKYPYFMMLNDSNKVIKESEYLKDFI